MKWRWRPKFTTRALLGLILLVSLGLSLFRLVVKPAITQNQAIQQLRTLGFSLDSRHGLAYHNIRSSQHGGRDLRFRDTVYDSVTGESDVPWFMKGRVGSLFRRVIGVTVSGPYTTDENLQAVGNLPYLQQITLSHNIGITGSFLQFVEHPNGIRILYLQNSGIKNESLIHLKRLSKLELLDVSNTLVTNDGLRHIGEADSITFLHLKDNQIDDEELVHLRPLKWLKHLDLRGTQVTAEGIRQLQAALPVCRILSSQPQPTNNPPRGATAE